MTEPHTPRENDHLVEPFYAGLGAEETSEVRTSRVVRLVLAVVISGLVLWLLFGGG